MAAAIDGILSHQILVVEDLILLPRGVIEDRAVCRDRVIDGLTEMPELRSDRIHQVLTRQLLPEDQRNFLRGRITYGLGQNADNVVEIRRRAQAAVVPRGIVRAAAHRHAGFVFSDHPAVDRAGDLIEL